MRKLTVLIDMDDTIEDLLGAWVTALNEQYGLSVHKDSVTDWDISKFFPPLTKRQVFAPIYSDDFWKTVQPIDGAADALRQLIADGHTVYIVTSSSYETLPVKMTDVLFRFFPFLKWDDVIVTSHKQLIRGDILIDDAPHNLVNGDYFKILFTCPHNKRFDCEKYGIRRADTWDDVKALVRRIAEGRG